MTARNRIPAGLMTAALVVATFTAPARAQWAVFDASTYAQALNQVKALQQQYQTLQQQLATAKNTYASVAHLPDTALKTAQSQLNTSQFRNPLGTAASDIGAMMNGSSTGTGALAGVTQGYLGQNQVYAATGSDFQAQQMTRNATSIAGVEAMASELYRSAASHMETLRTLESQLTGAPDAKAVADVSARLQMEQASFQAQQVQAQSLVLWQSAQERNQDQRVDEDRRGQVDRLIEEAKAHGG